MASVRGNEHRQTGQYRQDDAGVVAHSASGTVLFAVMDGVSSAPLAHVGARRAGQAALASLATMLDLGGPVDWGEVLGAAAEALLNDSNHGGRSGETVADVERHLGTTIVTGIVRSTPSGLLATLVRVGDSGAWLMRESRFTSLFPSKDAGETIDPTVVALPRLPDRINPVDVPLAPGSVLLVGTDGIGDPLGDGTGLVGELLGLALREPPPLLGLAHAVDFSRDTFDDDRTLVAIWPRP
jgi:hypothetical protein